MLALTLDTMQHSSNLSLLCLAALEQHLLAVAPVNEQPLVLFMLPCRCI